MPDLRWTDFDDFVRADGALLGFIARTSGGFCVYVIHPAPGKRLGFRASEDHPTEAAARAWVEVAVRTGGAE